MCCLVSGVSRLEQMCGFACLSVVVVNYLVLVMFYPACLSLVLKLSNRCSLGQPPWQMASLARALGDHKKPNPVVQRVKLLHIIRFLPESCCCGWLAGWLDAANPVQQSEEK
ncbi:3-hydroxy-3-methylglutaryl-coenzyme A reductase-like isoform X2 [Oratosquilla oratoria]|uniref:3-hydroxy-3-methylglutaryl-coenzyme A reductase-like isoform X2 n=1 Tax=Oratosquilla oratoria TaxID=337810 RepID=UPI003F774FF1